MKLYKYVQPTLWIVYIILLLLFINFLIFSIYTKGLVSTEFIITALLSIFHLTGVKRFIKNVSEDIFAKGHFSDYAQETLNSLIVQSDNANIVPFTKIKIKGLDKNLEELDEEKRIMKVFLRKDDDFDVVKSQISLIMGKWLLPSISKQGILDENSLQALRLLVAKNINYDLDIKNQINNSIKLNEGNKKFDSWFRKWSKIYSLPNPTKPQKNILFEFIKPKFENIANDKSKKLQSKKEEVNFLIEEFCEEKMVILFIDDNINIEGKSKLSLIDYYLKKAKSLFNGVKFIILASRGRNNWINNKVAESLINEKIYKLKYPFEKDRWIFIDKTIVDVYWRIIEKMKGT